MGEGHLAFMLWLEMAWCAVLSLATPWAMALRSHSFAIIVTLATNH
jgi:hypothetical protein